MTYPRRLLSLGLTSGMVVMLASLCRAFVVTPLLRLNASQAGDFHQAVTALAEQGHVALVAEGVPLHPHLSTQDAAKLTAAASLNDEVKTVAAAYDYSVQRNGNIFILKKRYSDPDDLPALTQAECERIFSLLPRVADPFNPHVVWDHIQFLAPPGPQLRRDQVRLVHPLMDSFAASLTPTQVEAIHQNKLSVSSLSQDQQKLARQLQLTLHIQRPMEAIDRLLSRFKLAKQSAVFCWHDTPSFHHVFGYTTPMPSGALNPAWFHPLSRSTGFEDLGFSGISPPKPTDPDPTDPPPIPVQTQNSAVQTLVDAVTAVNALPGGTTRIDVDTAAAPKPVTLVGAGNAPAGQVLHALADVYGLRLSDPSPARSGTFSLTLPDVLPPSDLAGLPSSLRQALPEPFLRVAHLDRIVAEEQQFDDFWQTPRFPKRPAPASRSRGVEETQTELEQAMRERRRAISGDVEFNAGLERIKQAEAALPALRVAAIRRLRSLVEPKLQTNPAGVPLADLGEPEHEAMATIFLVEATQAILNLLTQRMPESVLHFDQATLGGGIQENSDPPLFSVMFYMPDAAGRLEMNGGGMGVPYYKDSGRDSSK